MKNLLYTPVDRQICIEAAEVAISWVMDYRSEERIKAYEEAMKQTKFLWIFPHQRTHEEAQEHLSYLEENVGYPIWTEAPWINGHRWTEETAESIRDAANLTRVGDRVYLSEEAAAFVTKWHPQIH